MIPLVGVPKSIGEYLEQYREVFKRKKGFEIVSRFITGLILSPNKTLESIHSQQFWSEGEGIKRRAMHHAVFEAGWDSEEIMPKHREIIASEHRGKGKEVISLDWTLRHHEKGEHIYGVKKLYDYVEGKMSRYQTIVTSTIANREIITPRFLLADALHWDMTRIIRTWNYRWSIEVFHEFAKQITGLESSQVRKEEAVKRHFRLSCVAQSLLQRVTCQGQKSERFNPLSARQNVI